MLMSRSYTRSGQVRFGYVDVPGLGWVGFGNIDVPGLGWVRFSNIDVFGYVRPGVVTLMLTG